MIQFLDIVIHHYAELNVTRMRATLNFHSAVQSIHKIWFLKKSSKAPQNAAIEMHTTQFIQTTFSFLWFYLIIIHNTKNQETEPWSNWGNIWPWRRPAFALIIGAIVSAGFHDRNLPWWRPEFSQVIGAVVPTGLHGQIFYTIHRHRSIRVMVI